MRQNGCISHVGFLFNSFAYSTHTDMLPTMGGQCCSWWAGAVALIKADKIPTSLELHCPQETKHNYPKQENIKQY